MNKHVKAMVLDSLKDARRKIDAAILELEAGDHSTMALMVFPECRDLVTVSDDFSEFWALYPRRTGKGAAMKAWKTAKPNIEVVKSALSWQVSQASWAKDGGAFIPHPATWLNQRRWEDEPMALSTSYQPPTTTKSGRTMAAAQAALERL